MKIVITGGAGFIGSHLSQNLESNGHAVTVLDNFSTGSFDNLNAINFQGRVIEGDIRDQELTKKAVSEADTVIHMAAALGVDNIMNSTIESISTNLYGSEIVLLACAELKKRTIIASTSEVYGKNPKQPLSEEDDRVIGAPQNYRWTYSDSKAIEESIARVLFIERQLPVTTLRFFNTVGPRQSAQYGMVLPRFVKAALSGTELLVYGDGKQTRVFGHVKDSVRAVVSVLNNEKTKSEVFNVGGFGEISIIDLAKKVIDISNSKSKIVFLPYKDVYPHGYEDMERRVPNTDKITKFTGWEPELGLDAIIEDVIASLSV